MPLNRSDRRASDSGRDSRAEARAGPDSETRAQLDRDAGHGHRDRDRARQSRYPTRRPLTRYGDRHLKFKLPVTAAVGVWDSGRSPQARYSVCRARGLASTAGRARRTHGSATAAESRVRLEVRPSRFPAVHPVHHRDRRDGRRRTPLTVLMMILRLLEGGPMIM